MGKFSVRARGSEGEKAAKHNSLVRTKVCFPSWIFARFGGKVETFKQSRRFLTSFQAP